MKKKPKERVSYRKSHFEDEINLDIESVFENEDDLEDDDEKEFDWELGAGEEPDESEGRKLVVVMLLVVLCVFVAAVVIFFQFIYKSRRDREAVEAQMNLKETAGQEDSKAGAGEDVSGEGSLLTGENLSESGNTSKSGKGETSEETGDIGQEKMPVSSPESSSLTEISVGASDDVQDPQTFGMAEGEGSGAQVTVSAVSKDETAEITMGIDVSKYQGTIDWAKVKESGVEFAMIRVGYRAKATGEIFEDPTARYNMQEAQAAGIKIGAYFFSSAVTVQEAKEEAAFTKDIISRYKITYPVAYNCEDFQSVDSRQNGLSATVRTELACAFLDEISAAGYTPMFYASKGELEGSAQWDTDTLSGKYKMWVAQYPDQPYPQTIASSYLGTHDMWQYTSQGIVAGISKKTDVNIAYFGYTKEAQAKDETPADIVEANPEVGIIFTEVNETVTAKQETNLRSEPSTQNDASIVGKLIHGDTATRTGIGHNGWSRVVYNGQIYYAVTSFLTTDMEDTGQQAPPQGPIYTPVNEQVTAKIETNLRTVPSTASEDTIVGLLHNGEVLTRVGIGNNGWSQLDYNGQTVYAVSSFLTIAQ